MMRGKAIFLGLGLSVLATVASAQAPAAGGLTPDDVNCSGVVTSESVPRDNYVITGEESNYKIMFDPGDSVFINKGSKQGVKAGDEFFVIRSVADPYNIDWTKWESAILRKMGTVWEDEGRIKVETVRADISIARIEHACDSIQRGDTILPFAERPMPPLKAAENFDRFAPANGKALAMVITGKKFQGAVGREDVVYVNLGAAQGVKVGDYFRIFRYQGTHETVYQTPRYEFDQEYNMGIKDVNIVGFGSVPKKWDWNNTPRESLGEGIVLRTGPNSATVMITFSLREIYPGDYVEVE
jgi:hypothetical protein